MSLEEAVRRAGARPPPPSAHRRRAALGPTEEGQATGEWADTGPCAGPRELAGAQVDAPSQREHYQEGAGGRTWREAGRVGLQEGPERRTWVRQEWMVVWGQGAPRRVSAGVGLGT